MAVTVQDLEAKAGQGNILYCPCCGNEYSADAGDYFWMNRDEVFTCEECEDELELVQKRTSYVRV
jgi:transcription initiation factor IIE alpha subunit